MSLASTLAERDFSDRRRSDWDELDALTMKVRSRGLGKLDADDITKMSPLYRNVCADLAAAQAARYSAPLVDYLLGLTAASHAVVYGPHTRHRGATSLGARQAWFGAFPQAVRTFKWEMLLAAALFFVPHALGYVLAVRDPSFAFRVVPEAMLRPLADSYAKGFDAGREVSEGVMMAGFYVNNNVGIALRCFATGIFGGLGSAFYLVQNGLFTGAVIGYVASQGAGGNILVFIVGHGSLELGAIVLAGGAGLALGWALVAPGDLPRWLSVQNKAREIIVVVAGAAVMLFMAAGVEAFWSASNVPNPVKMGVGVTMFVLVLSYICLAGRAEQSAAEEKP